MEGMQEKKELSIRQMAFIGDYRPKNVSNLVWFKSLQPVLFCYFFFHYACVDLNSFCCPFQFVATYVDKLATIGLSALKEERCLTQMQHHK